MAVTQAEAAAGGTLALAVAAALLWANSAAHSSYIDTWAHPVEWFPLPSNVPHNVRSVINDGLMTVFFLGVGLEIGRERAVGSLRNARNAVLPIVAAIGGMAGAAVIFLVVAAMAGGDQVVRSGWGIPMATDVAFPLVILAALGERVPRELRVFVLALAVADDVASVIVLAVVSSREVAPIFLCAGGMLLVSLSVLGWLARRSASAGSEHSLGWISGVAMSRWPYVLGLIGLWLLLSQGGVEPALAGVFVGLTVPNRPWSGPDRPPSPESSHRSSAPSGRLERLVLPLSAWAVLPLFALANTGIQISAHLWSHPPSQTVLIAVVLARVVGKLAGIAGACALLLVLKVTRLPSSMRTSQLVGVALLCGIGFTVPILFADSAFSGYPSLVRAASAGLLIGSFAAFILGTLWLVVAGRRLRQHAVSKG